MFYCQVRTISTPVLYTKLRSVPMFQSHVYIDSFCIIIVYNYVNIFEQVYTVYTFHARRCIYIVVVPYAFVLIIFEIVDVLGG